MSTFLNIIAHLQSLFKKFLSYTSNLPTGITPTRWLKRVSALLYHPLFLFLVLDEKRLVLTLLNCSVSTDTTTKVFITDAVKTCCLLHADALICDSGDSWNVVVSCDQDSAVTGMNKTATEGRMVAS